MDRQQAQCDRRAPRERERITCSARQVRTAPRVLRLALLCEGCDHTSDRMVFRRTRGRTGRCVDRTRAVHAAHRGVDIHENDGRLGERCQVGGSTPRSHAQQPLSDAVSCTSKTHHRTAEAARLVGRVIYLMRDGQHNVGGDGRAVGSPASDEKRCWRSGRRCSTLDDRESNESQRKIAAESWLPSPCGPCVELTEETHPGARHRVRLRVGDGASLGTTWRVRI